MKHNIHKRKEKYHGKETDDNTGQKGTFEAAQRGIDRYHQQNVQITAFKRICNVPAKLIDLQLYYVECGIEFTNMLGDINESFYNSMAGMYETVVKSLIKSEDLKLIEEFMPRLQEAVTDTDTIGWGFHDDLCYTFSELEDFKEEL